MLDQLLQGVRGHWVIENSNHYVKDVTFGEDACRVKEYRTAQILSFMRNAAMNLLRNAGFENIAEGIRNLAYGEKTAALKMIGVT